jgi:hypothetical protein
VSNIAQWHIDAAKRQIVCDGNGGHDWLRFNKELRNFTFHVKWRFTPIPGPPKYNSGVFFRNDADGTIWHQAQTTPEGGYLFGVTPVDGKLTSFNEQKKMTENRIKPAGEWNVYDIRCVGRDLHPGRERRDGKHRSCWRRQGVYRPRIRGLSNRLSRTSRSRNCPRDGGDLGGGQGLKPTSILGRLRHD